MGVIEGVCSACCEHACSATPNRRIHDTKRACRERQDGEKQGRLIRVGGGGLAGINAPSHQIPPNDSVQIELERGSGAAQDEGREGEGGQVGTKAWQQRHKKLRGKTMCHGARMRGPTRLYGICHHCRIL